jgi:hypothetical protein
MLLPLLLRLLLLLLLLTMSALLSLPGAAWPLPRRLPRLAGALTAP